MYRFKIFVMLVFFSSILTAQKKVTDSTIKPIAIDKSTYSGLNLKSVKSKHQPERIMFQKKLFGGDEIGVFIVMTETKHADWEDFSLDELIFVINGRARLKPKGKENVYFNKGEFFVTPQGWDGTWETQGGNTFYHELAVVALNRDKTKKGDGIGPVAIDKAKLSGIGTTTEDILFKNQLTVKASAEKPTVKQLQATKDEQLFYVLSGQVTLTPKGANSQTFYTDEFFVLPKGFVGELKTEAHGLFRLLTVTKTK